MSAPNPIPAATQRPLNRGDLAIAAGLFTLSLISRLHFLLTAADRAWPHSAWFQGDAPLWADWAAAIGRGDEFEHGLAVHTPGVSYLLHWLGFGVGTSDFTGAKVVWCFASALGCALTYIAVRLLASRRIAAIAAIFLCFSFPSYITATSLNGEALYTALLPILVIGHVALASGASWFTAITVGAAHGAATLIRAEHTLLLILLVALTLWQRHATLTTPRPALRTAALVSVLALASIAVCLPWSLRSARAIHRFNTVAEPIDYDRSIPPFTPDARAYFESLPAFARRDNFAYLTHLARQRGIAPITPEFIRDYFKTEFGYEPEPLRRWHLASSQGPFSFALANHPRATGGFSKAGLDNRFEPDPVLNFALPTHLYLYNHGYRAGLASIREDPTRWLNLVGRKLAIFAEGATQGLTARNWPLGREGTRRAVDLFTAQSTAAPAWRTVLAVLFIAGILAARRIPAAAPWLVIILYKVIVTTAFYGYARQAASILPAFAVLYAIGLDALLGLASRRFPVSLASGSRRFAAALWTVPIAALLLLDLTATRATPIPAPGADAWPAPRWGPGAFESFSDITLRRGP